MTNCVNKLTAEKTIQQLKCEGKFCYLITTKVGNFFKILFLVICMWWCLVEYEV